MFLVEKEVKTWGVAVVEYIKQSIKQKSDTPHEWEQKPCSPRIGSSRIILP